MEGETLNPWENLKCDECGDPARAVAFDVREVPTPGPYAKKVPAGAVHVGCEKHPVRSLYFRLDGRVEVR